MLRMPGPLRSGRNVLSADVPVEAVRRYLHYLKDPSSLIDHRQVTALEAKLEEAADVVERLALREQLQQARTVDAAAVRDAFVTHAKAWADEQGITADAFRAEGVPDDALAEAGLLAKPPRRSRTRRSPAADAVRSALPKQEGQAVTVHSLAAKTGASVDTVRSVVKQEVKAGRLKRAGADREHSEPGRPPTLYVKGRAGTETGPDTA